MRAPSENLRSIGRVTLGLVAAVCLLGLSVPAYAATGTISGTVLNSGGAGVAGIRVVAYRSTSKGYQAVKSVVTPAGGAYSLTGLVDGTYKILARINPSGNTPTGGTSVTKDDWYGDKIIEEQASTVTIKNANTVSGRNLTLSAGTWGSVYVKAPGGAAVSSGMLCRAEDETDPRVNHLTSQMTVAVSGSSPGYAETGRCVFLGIEPTASANGAYHLWLHDTQARYKDLFTATPKSAATNSYINWGNVTLTALPADPNEPNNSLSAFTNINSGVGSNLYGYPAATYTVSNGVITPGDVDVYCWLGQAGDRFIVTATTSTNLTGSQRYSPFVDPYLQVHGAVFGNKANDDGGPGPLDARVDTGLLAQGQQVCAEVSTYNDTTLTGASQGSHGTYSLVVGMGNRPPVITKPADGSSVQVLEGATINEAITVQDPDSAHPTLTATLQDTGGNVVSKGSLTYDPTACTGGTGSPFTCDGSWSWTTATLDSNGSPYSLILKASDGEFTTTSTVSLVVAKNNLPPTTPVQTDPADGSQVASNQPTLTITNSTDPNGDPITYHFELYDTDPSTGTGITPIATQDVANDPSGSTSWATTQTLTENKTYWWRVQADDGTAGANATSSWTGYWSFFVNTVNDPPLPPQLTEPVDGSTVQTVQPTLTVNNTTDPEGDPITLYYEISTDPTFADTTQTVATSQAVPQVSGTSTTDWPVDAAQRLKYGTDYYARAYAQDDKGAQSTYSNVNHFTTPADNPPTDPSLGAPFDATCSNLVITDSANIPTQVVVNNPTDPENDPLQLELQVYDASADPSAPGFTPAIDTTVAVDTTGTTTTIPVDPSVLTENGHFIVRVQASDGTMQSNWVQCDLWINTTNTPPSAVTILSPTKGSTFDASTTTVSVKVQNASDPDYGIPGTSLAIAYCASKQSDFSDCPTDQTTWPNVPQTSGDPTGTTDFPLSVAAGDTWYVKVCAIDESGVCGATDQTNFSVKTASAGTDGGSGGTDGGSGGGTDGGSGSGATPGGCCTTARGGQPVMALWAALGLLLLIPRRRRYRG